jgi:hypothetical protein
LKVFPWQVWIEIYGVTQSAQLRSACSLAMIIRMPIRPQFRWFYPIDWRELSAVIRFERAKSRCERCRRPHGQVVYHLGDGRWWDEAELTWRNGRGRKLKGVAVRLSLLRTTRWCWPRLTWTTIRPTTTHTTYGRSASAAT